MKTSDLAWEIFDRLRDLHVTGKDDYIGLGNNLISLKLNTRQEFQIEIKEVHAEGEGK